MTGTLTSYRSPKEAGRDGFPQLLRAEWTKFRTVRGWVIGLVVAALVTVLLGVLAAASSQSSCNNGPCGRGSAPIGPDGEGVNDSFSFVHQQLTGNGSITARVGSLTGLGPPPGRSLFDENRGPDVAGPAEPWAKAGIIVKANITQGSQYAAIMLTGGHGVRMQDNYTEDVAGSPGAAPRWLRLTRSGDTLTGYESADGTTWTQVGTAELSGLPASVPAGMFTASPEHEEASQQFGGSSASGGPTRAIGVFDRVGLQGQASGQWQGDHVGVDSGLQLPGLGFTESGGTFTVTGTGNIAPASGPSTVEHSLVGGFAGLIVVIVLGALFSTAEYRRGLIRMTLAASPRRGRVLAAKALVLGAVTFAVGLVAAAAAVFIVGPLRISRGESIMPVSGLTELRVIVGTAALLAVAAVFAMAVGMVLRRSAGAVTAVIVLLVLPYIFGIASVLPVGAAQVLLRITPAAAFAVQQSIPAYAQVDGAYWPSTGYFPLSPLGGLAVLCAWTVAALALAAVLLRRRDA